MDGEEGDLYVVQKAERLVMELRAAITDYQKKKSHKNKTLIMAREQELYDVLLQIQGYEELDVEYIQTFLGQSDTGEKRDIVVLNEILEDLQNYLLRY